MNRLEFMNTINTSTSPEELVKAFDQITGLYMLIGYYNIHNINMSSNQNSITFSIVSDNDSITKQICGVLNQCEGNIQVYGVDFSYTYEVHGNSINVTLQYSTIP